jgi:hypothetical protein
LDPAVAAQIAAKERLQQLAAGAAVAAWDALPHYDRANIDQFLSTALPVLAGANLQSVALTQAYLAHVLDRQPVAVDAHQVVAGIRNGATPEEVYRRPFVTVWSALSHEKPYADAVATGRARVATAAATDVQLAFRNTLQAVGAADHRIMGYERVANAKACEFCQRVNGAQFLKQDPMPLHPHCACGVRVVEYTRGRGKGSLLERPLPDGVAVHEHGELGPVLGDPNQHFTGEHALAA